MPEHVSVVIPTYNRADLLARALRSVVSQTHRELEVLVVDDASNDGTEQVVASFEDPRVRYLRHPVNRGGSAARNTGILAATGDYIGFLDSDDEFLPNKLEKQVSVFRNSGDPRLGLVTCGWIDLRGKGGEVELPRPDVWTRELFLTFECRPHGTPTLLLRTDAFPTPPLFDERLPANQDWDYVYRLLENCTVAWCNEPLLKVMRSEGSYIGTTANRIAARRLILEKYAGDLGQNPAVRSLHHHQLGFYLAREGFMGEARYHLWQAIKSDPGDHRKYTWLFGSIFGRRGLLAARKLVRPQPALGLSATAKPAPPSHRADAGSTGSAPMDSEGMRK